MLSTIRILMLVAFVLLGGCATTLEQKHNCSGSKGKNKCRSLLVSKPMNRYSAEIGVVYALPKQQLKFIIDRNKITKSSLESEINKAKTKELELKKELDEFVNNMIPTLNNRLKKSTKSENKIKVELLLEIATIDKLLKQKQYSEAKKQRITAERQLSSFKGPHFKDTIRFEQMPLVPDTDNMLVAKMNHNSFSSDTFELKTTQEGLLNGGTGKSEGRVDEVFVALTSSLASIKTNAEFRSFSAKGVEPHSQAANPSCPPMAAGKFEFIVDVNDPKYHINLNRKLNRECYGYEVRLKSRIKPKACSISRYVDKMPNMEIQTASEENKYWFDGLVYPRYRTLQFDVSKKATPSVPAMDGKPAIEANQKTFVTSFFPQIVDACSLGVVPLNKALFADNEYEFEFKKGLLTRYKAINPSEMTSFLGIFPKTAKELLSVPAELIQLKINYNSGEKAYYEALLAAREARRIYQESLDDNDP